MTYNQKVHTFFGIAAVLLILVFSISVFDRFSGTQNLIVKIEWNDAARECVSKRRKFISNKYRSSVPKNSLGFYCGIIKSDHGAFLLPESNAFFSAKRSDLYDVISEGCTYQIKITGFDDDLHFGKRAANYGLKTVRKIELLNCG